MKRIIILLTCVPIVAHAATVFELADGELCLHSSQCVSGVCLRQDGLSLARCAPKAQLGEECSAFYLGPEAVYYKSLCETGLVCKADASATSGNYSYGVCVELHGECPSGYIEVDEPYTTLVSGLGCGSDTNSVGTAISCLAENPTGNCIMYIPVGMSLTDDTGTYEFTKPCALE